MPARRRASRPTSRSSMPAWPNSSLACSVSLTTGLDIRTILATLPSCSSRQLFCFSLFFRVRSHSAKIYGSNVRNDPETIAEVYLRISNDYFDSPDLRVQWLRNLAEFQVNVNHAHTHTHTHTHTQHCTRRFLLVAMFFFLTIAVLLATSKATRRRPPSVSCTLPRSWWNISSPRANSRYRFHPHARSLPVVPTHRAAHSIGV